MKKVIIRYLVEIDVSTNDREQNFDLMKEFIIKINNLNFSNIEIKGIDDSFVLTEE